MVDELLETVARLGRENAELRARLERRDSAEAPPSGAQSPFRMLVETMPQLVWTCSADGRCEYLGPQWVAYTGTAEAEQLGYGWLEQVHPDDRERVNARWAETTAAGLAFDMDFRIRAANRQYRWFKARAVPAHDADGRIVRWLGTNTDIEDLRESEQQVRRLTDGLEREVAERTEQLRNVTERLLTATSAANLGIWEWDVVSNSVVWDERTYQLYGRDASDFSGPSEAWQSAVHPDDRDKVSVIAERAISGAGAFDVKVRVPSASGGLRHLHATATVVRGSDLKAVKMLGVVRDITAEVVAQEQLRINEERWNLALEGNGDGVWDWDLVTDDIFLSNRSRELLGYSGQEVVKSTSRKAEIHPDDAERTRLELERHLQGQTATFECEYRLRCKDGSYRWIQGTGRVIARDSAGKPLRIVGTHKDIAERRQAREALENREALLREFITHTPAAIAMLDTEMRYLQASRRWLADYKLSGQDVIGRSHYEVFRDIPDRWKEIHRRVLAGSVESCDEDPFPRSDGGLDWLKWEARPWYDNVGAIGGLIFFTQVITERKELGSRLEEQNRQLAHSNSELEQFAYVASHDLQEPLRAIAGCTQILAQRYRGHLDRDADALVEHIVDGASRMKALIEGLLSLSRVGAQKLAPSSVETTEVFRQAIGNLQASIQEAEAKVQAGPLPSVSGDATQLLQLFQNLIGNALKYRAAEAPAVTLSAVQEENFQHFRVGDNGIGIDPRYSERIFGVFQRLHTRGEYPGTGIGLAICRKIVERHGGRLWVESSLGHGSTFHFTLPACRAAERAAL